MTSNIPSIDLGPFLRDEGILTGDSATKEQLEVATAIDAACRDHGFIHLSNYGLSDDLRQRCFGASAELFAFDDSFKKERLVRICPETNMGYAPFRTEQLNRNRPADWKEAYNVRFPPAHTNDFRGCPPGFEGVVAELQSVLKVAARRYGLACALAFGLPEKNFFSRTLAEFNLCTVRFLHYPPCDYAATSPDGSDVSCPIRIGEHTDFGAYTFLLLGEHGAEGLQVKPIAGGEAGGNAGGESSSAGGKWLDVQVPPFSTIVTTGALMARWTNDEWKATAHRVVVPTPVEAGRDRFSIAFFVDPDRNEIVEAHDAFCRDGKERKYESISSMNYLAGKLREMMGGNG